MLSPLGSQCPITDLLRKRYVAFHQSAKLPKRLAARASPPLLVLPHAKWQTAKSKLLIVGQETRRWTYDPREIGEIGDPIKSFAEFSNAKHGVRAMWDLYRWYALGRTDPKLNSPFWRGFRTIDAAINESPDAALWTNIFKMNVNGSVMRNCKVAEITALKLSQQGLLREEIAILKPDIVVFFSGPTYDSVIRTEFPDMQVTPVCRKLPRSVVGVVHAEGLPMKTVRTYHPEYLQRSRQLGILSEISRWAKS